MLKPLQAGLLFLVLTSFSLQAAPSVGMGLMVGEPSGGTLKLWVDRDEAWVFGLGVSPMGDPSIQAQADYVLHIYEIAQAAGLNQTPLYCGLGLRLNGPEDGRLEIGIRIPAGLSHFFNREGVEVFAELAPVLNVIPEIRGELNFGVGIRFYR